MAVLTISRKLGSKGDFIAKQVSEKLGYKLVDKKFIGSVLEKYGLVEFDREYDHLPSIWERLDLEKEERRDVLVDMFNRVIRAVAREDNIVILGRSGYVVLADFANVLNVRVQAPLRYRITEIAAKENISVEEAEKLIKQSDKVSANFVESFYGVDWDDINAFDIVINGEKIPANLAINCLAGAMRNLSEKELDIAKTTASIKRDATLRKVILEKFESARR